MEKIIQKFKDTQDLQAFGKEVANFFNLPSISEATLHYLQHSGVQSKLGNIYSFEKCWKNHYTYKKLFSKDSQDIFPMITIGGNSYGVDFWLDLASGNVVSLHHDATFYEYASDIKQAPGPLFCETFVKMGSEFTISELIALIEATVSLSKDYVEQCIQTIRAVQKIKSWDLKTFDKKLNRTALEFIFTRVQGFVEEEGGLKWMAKAEKKLSVLESDLSAIEKLDLSECKLSENPSQLKSCIHLKSLNLSKNPIKFNDELVNLNKLTQLKLEKCCLVNWPQLPENLQELDASNNHLKNVDSLLHLNQPRKINLKGNVNIPKSVIQQFIQKNPKCKLEIDIETADFDAETLSFRMQDLVALPNNIVKYKNLKHLDLYGNPRLNFAEVFDLLAPFYDQLISLDLTACKLSKLDDKITQFKKLEYIYLNHLTHQRFAFSNEFFAPEGKEEILNTIVKLTKLKHLKEIPYQFFGGFGYLDEAMALMLEKFENAESAIINKFTYSKDVFLILLKSLNKLNKLKKLTFYNFTNEEFSEALDVSEGHCENLFQNVVHLEWFSGSYPMPNLFLKFKNLKTIVSNAVEDNFLENIDVLSDVKHLELNMEYQKPAFPGKIGKLKNLEYLRLEKFSINDFTNAFECLENLKTLVIKTGLNHEVSYDIALDESVQNLKNVESIVFDFEYQTLNSLTDAFASLKKLKYLEINNGEKRSHSDSKLVFPENFHALSQLESLKVSGNISTFPSSFAQLPSLKNLFIKISNNAEDYKLNEGFGKLPQLQNLKIEGGFDFESLEKELSGLTKLKTLNLRGYAKGFYPFSSSVKNCVALEKINVSFSDLRNNEKDENLIYQNYVESLLHFPNVKDINFSSVVFNENHAYLNQFNFLDTVCLSLDYDNKKFDESLLELVSSWKNLKHLKIYNLDSRHKILPNVFEKMTQIEVLSLGFTGLKTFGAAIYQLKNLKRIALPFMAKSKFEAELKKKMPWCTLSDDHSFMD